MSPFVKTADGMAFMQEPPKPQPASKKSSVDLSRESALVIDYGYFPEMAKRMAEEYGTVYYGASWHSYNPTPDKCWMGLNIPSLIHMEEYDMVADNVDLLAFFDVGDHAKQEAYRRRGKKVFGAGCAELIELDRAHFKDVLKQAGLSGPPYEIIYGIDALRDYLKTRENLWVKIDSKWRGIKETWFHEDWESSITTVDELAHTLGCFRNMFRFVVEECWPGLETGCDFFISDGRYLPIGTYGFEEKNEGYICKATPLTEMPKAVRAINDGMAPFYEMWNTCGMASTEVRVLCEALYKFKVGEPYFLDATQRAGSPPAEIISALYTNLPHIIRACANGEMITPAPRAKYAAQVILKSAQAMHESCPVSVEKGFEDRVKFRRQCMIEDQMFIIPMHGDEIIGSAVGWGNTRGEAQDMALEAADKVHCKELYYNCAVFQELDETLANAEALGLGKF